MNNTDDKIAAVLALMVFAFLTLIAIYPRIIFDPFGCV